MITYEPLWTTIKNKNIVNKTDLIQIAGISPTTLSKLSKNKPVNMKTLEKLGSSLNCNIESIVAFDFSNKENKIKNVDKKKTLKVVSLFSGVGGFEEGIRNSLINGEIVYASEIDKSAMVSYASNFSSNNLVGDITKVQVNSVPNHELLVAGFPCQSFSIAGRREGFEDKTRGTLFFDIVRILKEKQPRYILLENVKNLISHDRGRTIQVILESLQKLGYTLDFTVINSNEAGVPQNRERTYIVGILNQKVELFNNDDRNRKINNLKSELNLFGFNGFNFFDSLKFKNTNSNLFDILESKVDDKYYFNSKKLQDYLKSLEIKEKSPSDSKIIKLFDIPREVHNDNERQRRVYSIKGISPTLLARSDTTKILVYNTDQYRIRKLTPTENFRVQGFNDDFIRNIIKANISDTQMYKQSGNAVSPPVITGIINHLYNYIN